MDLALWKIRINARIIWKILEKLRRWIINSKRCSHPKIEILGCDIYEHKPPPWLVRCRSEAGWPGSGTRL